MRHKLAGRKLGVTTKHRKSMFRNMVTDLLRNEWIKTTDTKAKELRRIAEKMISLGKDGSLHKRRIAAAFIRDKEVIKKLFDELAEKFKDRPGGYTRIIKLGFRKGDNTPISLLELVQEEYKVKKKRKKPTTSKRKTDAKDITAAAAAVKSSKKESAEELGLIDDNKESIDKDLIKEVKAVDSALDTKSSSEIDEHKALEEKSKDSPDQQDTLLEQAKTEEAAAEAQESPDISKQEVKEDEDKGNIEHDTSAQTKAEEAVPETEIKPDAADSEKIIEKDINAEIDEGAKVEIAKEDVSDTEEDTSESTTSAESAEPHEEDSNEQDVEKKEE